MRSLSELYNAPKYGGSSHLSPLIWVCWNQIFRYLVDTYLHYQLNNPVTFRNGNEARTIRFLASGDMLHIREGPCHREEEKPLFQFGIPYQILGCSIITVLNESNQQSWIYYFLAVSLFYRLHPSKLVRVKLLFISFP